MAFPSNLNLLFKSYVRLPEIDEHLYWYALVDAAQDNRLPHALHSIYSLCLLTQAAGEKAVKVSPHLVQLSSDFNDTQWEWINQHAAGKPSLTLICSYLDFDQLFNHLQQFLDVNLEGGLEMTLAFWDPAILACLVGQEDDSTLYVQGPALSAAQKNLFLAPMHSWWYWDRKGDIHAIFGEREELVYKGLIPLQFTAAQEDMLVEATLPDTLLYYLNLNHPLLIEAVPEDKRYDFICQKIADARSFGLNGLKDMLNFICIILIYKERMNDDENILSVLERVKNKEINMDQAMQLLPE